MSLRSFFTLPERKSPGPRRALLVGPDMPSLEPLRITLEQFGLDVTPVAGVTAATEALAGGGFDVLLMTMGLGERTAGDVLALLDLSLVPVPGRVVLLTSANAPHRVARGLRFAVESVELPVRFEDLLEKLSA